MNKKDNQRSRLTRMLMKQAYLELMRGKPASKITVKDICESAEVNRSTFYLHYAEPNDILTELEDESISRISEALSAIGASDTGSQDARNYLLSFLRYIRQNDEMFRALLVENSDPHFRRKLQAVALNMAVNAFQVELPEACKTGAYLYIVSGSIELLSAWVGNQYEIPENVMCDMLYCLCEGSLSAVCSRQSAMTARKTRTVTENG